MNVRYAAIRRHQGHSAALKVASEDYDIQSARIKELEETLEGAIYAMVSGVNLSREISFARSVLKGDKS